MELFHCFNFLKFLSEETVDQLQRLDRCIGAVSDYCMVFFFRKVYFKSDTAVALRRSLSKVPCIIVVSSSMFIMIISVI